MSTQIGRFGRSMYRPLKFTLSLLMLQSTGWFPLGGLNAQVLISGTSGQYSQNFNSLAASGTTNPWIDNSTLGGWYVSATGTFGGDYRAGAGTSTTGDLYSFGTGADRALGSLVSATTGDMAYGVRLRNDTASILGNITVGFTGEQWRDSSTSAQKLLFSYQTSAGSIAGADASHLPGSSGWIGVSALDFTSPHHANAGAQDGGLLANRQIFGSTTLSGVQLPPGQELFLRWSDLNDSGNDHAFALDNVSVGYSAVPEPEDYALVAGLLAVGGAWMRRRWPWIRPWAGLWPLGGAWVGFARLRCRL